MKVRLIQASMLLLLGLLIFSFMELPPKGKSGNPSYNENTTYYLEHTQKDVNIPNTIAAILMDYRSVDTLGEATVLFAAVTSVYSVLKGGSKKGAEKDE